MRNTCLILFGLIFLSIFLFSGTIKSNIALNDDSYSDDDVLEVCKYVNADSFIFKNEKGLDAEVSPKGENFSQGQRQLLSFARTILHKPDILILDEATSSIDTRTELKIQEAFHKLMKGRTSFVIAHRLSTIKDADLILVMKDGDIIEQGNHEELLAKKGFYADLYNSQFENKATA